MARTAVALVLALSAGGAGLAAAEVSAAQVQELIEQNRRLQEQVRSQQATIDGLTARMTDVWQASERHERELRGLTDRSEPPATSPGRTADRANSVRISAEAGLAFFNTGREGQFPKAEFRADDPTLTFEAPVRQNVYFVGELKLLIRETNVENFELGELYVEFEDVSAAWGQPGLLNLRVGRLNVPFGEEYTRRGPLANPLISRSLSDLWGVDEGIGIYGRVGEVQYIVAVQNGGNSRLRDFNADKSVAARLSWQPLPWLSLSGSAMRTGEMATVNDRLTELWFANAFFRGIGPANRTGTFWVNLYEADVTLRWQNGHLGLMAGLARYGDSDPVVDNSRRLRFGAVEAVQQIAGGLFGAARYSQITVPGGYPLAGWGPLGTYFFRPVLTEELRRTSVGLGYRFGPPLVLKVEYTRETGHTTTGASRDLGDFFGAELGVRF